jgi:hypothetical protein
MVHFLCSDRQHDFFSRRRSNEFARAALCAGLRPPLRLFRCACARTIAPPNQLSIDFLTVTAAVHRFEESIGGRPYLIEVASVSQDRWRAYIVRVPGMPTALMPFYGRTPSEAAQLLSEWLTRAHARAAAGAGSV